ncbi:hypothetical protein NDU88_002579 [Pleurodeles waltl]|uniref:Uncharacterized protein n=1 Tax=Pleurodeles waltl TaxID=8319 RepID=A0AAV7MN33_PLEWA|nr:hypothetical protein NDU88_002579 [Pleurodeles waltl]
MAAPQPTADKRATTAPLQPAAGVYHGPHPAGGYGSQPTTGRHGLLIIELTDETKSIRSVIVGFQDRVEGLEQRLGAVEDRLNTIIDRD